MFLRFESSWRPKWIYTIHTICREFCTFNKGEITTWVIVAYFEFLILVLQIEIIISIIHHIPLSLYPFGNSSSSAFVVVCERCLQKRICIYDYIHLISICTNQFQVYKKNRRNKNPHTSSFAIFNSEFFFLFIYGLWVRIAAERYATIASLNALEYNNSLWNCMWKRGRKRDMMNKV